MGKAKNDGTYRLYDITHKIRDTAHRFNDVGRLQEFLPANSISTDKVTQNMKNVNYKKRKFATTPLLNKSVAHTPAILLTVCLIWVKKLLLKKMAILQFMVQVMNILIC